MRHPKEEILLNLSDKKMTFKHANFLVVKNNNNNNNKNNNNKNNSKNIS